MAKPANIFTDSEYVDEFKTHPIKFPEATLIGLDLYDKNREDLKPGHEKMPYKLRLTPLNARRLAQELLDEADKADRAQPKGS